MKNLVMTPHGKNEFALLSESVRRTPEARAFFAVSMLQLMLAHRLFQLRTSARLTRSECALRLGVSAAEVARIEAGDYPFSLALLGTIAAAFQKRVEVRFV